MMGSEGLQGLFQVLPINQLGETFFFFQIGGKSLPVQTDIGTAFSVLNPTMIKQSLPSSFKTVQIVGVSNEHQETPVSEHIPFCLGPLRATHPFLLIHLLGWDILEKYHARISFSEKGEVILEIDSSHQSSSPGELNYCLKYFICLVSGGTRIDSENTDYLSLLNRSPVSLLAKPSTDDGKSHSPSPIKIQIDPLKSLPGINQYLRSKEALQGIKPIIDYKASLSLALVSITLPFYWWENWGWRSVQDLWAINNIIIPKHSVVPNLHRILTSIPTGNKFFTVIDSCSAFFSIPVDEGRQYLFVFTWEEKQFFRTVIPEGFTESPSYFSKILKDKVDDVKFPRGSIDTVAIYGWFTSLLSFSSLLTERQHPLTKAFRLKGT